MRGLEVRHTADTLPRPPMGAAGKSPTAFSVQSPELMQCGVDTAKQFKLNA